MNKDTRIYVAGHAGLLGSALMRALRRQGCTNLFCAAHAETDLTSYEETYNLLADIQPEYVFLAAATVAGIKGNMDRPTEMLLNNLQIQNNVISCAHLLKVKKLMFFGSSCIYPKFCEQPIKETSLLSASLEPSNEYYAIAKIAGLKLCQAYRRQHGDDFISVMPCNLYGVNDTYSPGCHVIPDLIRRFHEAKTTDTPVVVWGDGSVRREFLFSDDLADAALLVMRNFSEPEPINIGSAYEVTIRTLAHLIADTVGLNHTQIEWDTSAPTGTPRKIMDNSKMRALGWHSKTSLSVGLKIVYADYLKRLC